MFLTKSETNNAIIVEITNVRPHPNADKLKLATVLGTQVVVGLDSKDKDRVVYFDSNLRLSNEYLRNNNLYSNAEMNAETKKKGYFGHNGRVKAQRFRGEISNGYVASLASLNLPGMGFTYEGELTDCLKVGDEFTHINGVEVCSKYIVPQNTPGSVGSRNRRRKTKLPHSDMFKQHWDTKQFMRECDSIPAGKVYIEEKIHGTSGRTANVLCKTCRPWYKFWVPKEKWKVLSGTRRRDNISDGHMWEERQEIEQTIASNLHKGETVYYEIYGKTKNGAEVQKGFSYDCSGNTCKAMLYRVTITTPDNFTVDLPREMVYKRAEELGLMAPILIKTITFVEDGESDCEGVHWGREKLKSYVGEIVNGNSAIANHMKEGVVVWFERTDGTWSNLKHKSAEFLMLESKQRDDNIGDVEDVL